MPKGTRRVAAGGNGDLLRSPAIAMVRLGDPAQTSLRCGPFEPFDGERKIVTVLFADIVRSSSLVSGIDPEDANDVLLSVLQLMIDWVHRFGGTVTQVLGDGIMTVFGAPTAQEDHAIRACFAADGMQAAARQAFHLQPPRAGPPIAIRIGLSSGEVVTQTVGNDLAAEYRVAGETVYLAARAAEFATPNSTLLTESALKLASGRVEASPVSRFSLTAASRPVATFRLTRVSREKWLFQNLAHGPGEAFIGRTNDLKVMHDALHDVERGNGKALLVTGEAGVGKSRLVYEFIASTGRNEYRVVECALLPTGLAKHLEPLARIVGNLMAIEPRDTADDIHAKTSTFLKSLSILEGDALAAVLGILDVPHDSPSWSGLDPPERLVVIIETVARMIVAASRPKPIIIVFEDFQWADSETRLLVDELVPRLSSSRVFLIITARTQPADSNIARPSVAEHRLRPLTARQSSELLEVLLGHAPDLDDLKDLLVKTTHGIPFFIEECVRSLEDSGALRGTEGAYRAQVPIENLHMPATVHGVLAARIDSLSKSDRTVLLCASVVGQSFDVGLLQGITDTTAEALITQLNRLQAAEFIQRTRILPNLEFSFRHALIHDVAYGTLLKRDRRALHARLMVAIRKRRAEQLAGKIELLAYHAFRAQAWPGAVIYGRKAGQMAQAKSRNREAADFFKKSLLALEQLPRTRKNTERSIDTRMEVVQSLVPLGKFAVGHDELLKARDSARVLGDERRLAMIAPYLTIILWKNGRLPYAEKMGRNALMLAKRLADTELELLNLVRLAGILADRGDYESACQLTRDAIAMIPSDATHERFGLIVVASVACHATMTRCLGELGQFDESIKAGDESVRISEETGHAFSQAYAYLWLGIGFIRRGEFARSIPLLERSFTLCESTRSKFLYPLCAASLGFAWIKTTDVPRGLRLLEEAIRIAERQTVTLRLSLMLAWLAEGYLDAGRADEAISFALKALESAKRNGEKAHEGWALWLLGEIHTNTPELSHPEAEEYFRKAQAIAIARHMAPLVAHCRVGRAKLYLRRGSWEQARREFDAAICSYRELDMGYWLKLAEAGAERKETAYLLSSQ